jgi:hypothetical protein
MGFLGVGYKTLGPSSLTVYAYDLKPEAMREWQCAQWQAPMAPDGPAKV